MPYFISNNKKKFNIQDYKVVLYLITFSLNIFPKILCYMPKITLSFENI